MFGSFQIASDHKDTKTANKLTDLLKGQGEDKIQPTLVCLHLNIQIFLK